MSDKIRVSILRNPFSVDRDDIEIERKPIYELVEVTGFDFDEVDALVIDTDVKIPEEQWDSVPSSDHVIIRAIPKNDVGETLFGGGIFTSIVGTLLLVTPLAPLGLVLIGVGVSMAIGGAVLMNFEIPTPGDRTQQTAPSVRGARNRTRIGVELPIVLGKHLVTPDNAALSYTYVVGDDQYVSQLFCHGSKNVVADAATMKFGETPITNYSDVSYQFQYGESLPNTYFPSRVIENAIQIEVKNSSDPIIRRTAGNTKKIRVIVSFPQGLCKYDKDDGDRKSYTVNYQVLWKKASSEIWTTSYNGGLTASNPRTIRRMHEIVLDNATSGSPDYDPERQYDVRILRISGDTDATNIIDSFYWDGLQSFTAVFDGLGGIEDRPIVQAVQEQIGIIGLNLRASDQLQGAIDQLNYVGQLHTLGFDGIGTGPSAWSTQATQNPAAMFRYILQDPYINPEPVPDDRIDWPSLEDWHEFCDIKGFECNAVITGETTINDLLNYITSTGIASWNQLNGKYTIIADKDTTAITQYFTPRNTWDYTGHRAFNKLPTTLKMQFIDASIGYVQAERLVAYNPTTEQVVYDQEIDAGEIQEVPTFGITDANQVAKIGAYKLAVAWLRREQHIFNVDIEYLICTRGDRVQLTHDVPMFGLGSGRISEVYIDGDTTVGIKVDSELKLDFGVSYGVVIRLRDGSSVMREIQNPAVDVPVRIQTLTFTTPLSGIDLMFKDDLLMFGEVGQETRDLIVMKIEPGSNLSAKLTCVDYDPAIYSADQGTIPQWDPGISKYASDVVVPVGIDVPNPGELAVEAINTAAEVDANSIGSDYYATDPGGLPPTTVPEIPVLSGNGIFRGFQINIEPQQNLMNPLRIELQVSADLMNWYSIGYGVATETDWQGVLDEVTKIPEPATLFVHAPTPFITQVDGNGDPYPVGRELNYRARRRTRYDVVSDWSTTLTLTSSVIENGTIGLNAIMANIVQAAMISATSQLVIGYASPSGGTPSDPHEGDRRVYIDNDEIAFEEYAGGAWSAVNSIKVGGVTSGGFFYPFLQCRGVVNPNAGELAVGNEPIPGGSLFTFETDFNDQNGEAPGFLSATALRITVWSKFGSYSFGSSSASTGANLQKYYPDGMTTTNMVTSAYFYLPTFASGMIETYIFYLQYMTGSTTWVSLGMFLYETGGVFDLRITYQTRVSGVTVDNITISLGTAAHGVDHFLGIGWEDDGDSVFFLRNNNKYYLSDFEIPVHAPSYFSGDSYSPTTSYARVSCGSGDYPFYIDDFHVWSGAQANIDAFIQHYNHDVPWDTGYNLNDVVLKPAPNGRVLIDGDMVVTGSGGGRADPAIVPFFNASNGIDQKNLKLELVSTGLQLNLYDDSGVFISTVLEQKYNLPTPGIITKIHRERIIGDAGTIVMASDTEVIHTSKTWKDLESYVTGCYGQYRAQADLYGSSATCYYRVLVNDVEVGRVTHGGSYATLYIDFDIEPGDSIKTQMYSSDDDIGDQVRTRNRRLLADSGTDMSYDFIVRTAELLI